MDLKTQTTTKYNVYESVPAKLTRSSESWDSSCYTKTSDSTSIL